MAFSKQGLKEFLDNQANLIIYDNYLLEDLIFLAKLAGKNEKHLTIRVLEKGLEDLKKVSRAGKGYVTIQCRLPYNPVQSKLKFLLIDE